MQLRVSDRRSLRLRAVALAWAATVAGMAADVGPSLGEPVGAGAEAAAPAASSLHRPLTASPVQDPAAATALAAASTRQDLVASTALPAASPVQHPAAATALPPAPPPLGPRSWLFLPLVNPTPRTVARVQVSAAHGLYHQPFDLTLQTATEEATIRYTLDGSPPSESHGTVYRAPIRIDRTTVLRAMATRPGYAPSPITTQTYIFLADVLRQPAWPASFPSTWGVYPPGSMGHLSGKPVSADYGMDPRIVEDPRYRSEIERDLQALPSLSVVADPADLFDAVRGIYANPLLEGAASERPASLELLPGAGAGFQVDCGLRIAGSWSRLPDSTLKHSFSVRFRSRYGTANLSYPLFHGAQVAEFDVLRLRGGQTDAFPYFADRAQYAFDQWARDSQRAMGWDSTYGTFVHLYLNGLYWGLYNVTEEPTAALAADHLGGWEEDYDVIKDDHAVEDGSFDGYAAMLATMSTPGLSDRERYERMAQWLDLVQFSDYNLLQIYAGNRDWPDHNYRAIRNRALGLPFQFYTWDMEKLAAIWAHDAAGHDATHPQGARVSIADTAGVDGIHGWLKQFAEYRFLFADRVRYHMFGNGALTPDEAGGRYAEISAPLDGPIVAESARWGDAGPALRTQLDNPQIWLDYWRRYGRTAPQDRDDQWRPRRDWLLRDFFPQRTQVVLGELCAAGLFPPVAAPEFQPADGAGGPWLRVSMRPGIVGCPDTVSEGAIYYTTDGSDPRQPWSETPGTAWSGRPSPSARVYREPIPVTGYTLLRARTLAADQWSALTEATYGTPRIVITEIMYHPLGGEDYEFLELQNREPFAVRLGGMRLSGVAHTFASGVSLPPGGYGVLARDAAHFRERYPGVPLIGIYDGKLANEGETLALWDRRGRLVTEVAYDDGGFWPFGPDGGGWSLVVVDPDGNPNDPENWRASARYHGSPGAIDPDRGYPRVVVNEILAEPEGQEEEAIELHNLTDGWADIGGWFLSDDRRAPKKYRLPPETMLRPRGYAVFYAQQFGSAAPVAFGLSGQGETVVLSSADGRGQLTGYMAGFAFAASEPGISWGRVPTTVGVDASPLESPTFGVVHPTSLEDFRRGTGGVNSPPRVGPLVINEVMLQPTDGRAEYIELFNRTAEPVPARADADSSHRWRLEGAVAFVLPPELVVPPAGYLVIAGTDPSTFRQQYAVPSSVTVLGPFQGELDDSGEELRLAKPVVRADGGVVYVPADRVAYRNRSPWPLGATGGGAALERRQPHGYGNEPANWTALRRGGTPGQANPAPRWLVLPLLPNG